MPTELDYMEYANDAAAQAAYVTNSSDSLQSYFESTIKTQGLYALKGVAFATGEVVDQQCATANSDTSLGDDSDNEYRESQGFQLSATLTITAVEIKQYATYGSPSGNWTLRIETNNAGKPSGTLADANASVVVTPPGNGNIIKGTFTTPFQLAGSTLYHLVVQCDNQATNQKWTISFDTTQPYTSGSSCYSSNGGSTWNINPDDLYFKVYVLSGSLNKTLTRTIT